MRHKSNTLTYGHIGVVLAFQSFYTAKIQGDSGGKKVIVLGSDNKGHCQKKKSNEHVSSFE